MGDKFVFTDQSVAKAEAFCEKIGAELIYFNDKRFAVKLESGETRFIYWTELDKLLHDSGLKEKKMRQLKELRRKRCVRNCEKAYGRNWEDFLTDLSNCGFDFNDHYYDAPHHWIDATKDGVIYEIEVEKHSDGSFETTEFGEIPDEVLKKREESQVAEIARLQEAERFTHKIVILPKDSGVSFTSAAEKKLRFKSYEEAEKYMNQLLSGGYFADKLKKKGFTLGVEEIPKKVRNTGTNAPDYENPFEVGDILYGDVGYSMQMPEWYKVIKKTDKSVICRRLATRVVNHDGYGQRGEEMPIPDAFHKWGGTVNGKSGDEPVTMRVKKWGTTWSRGADPKDQYYASLGGSRYGNIFSLWDGKPKSFDYYD